MYDPNDTFPNVWSARARDPAKDEDHKDPHLHFDRSQVCVERMTKWPSGNLDERVYGGQSRDSIDSRG